LLAILLQPDAFVHAVAVIAVTRACDPQAWDDSLEVAAEGLLGATLLAADAVGR
jgi:hypothetical protein